MELKTQHYQLDEHLGLRDRSLSLFPINSPTLAVTKLDNEVIDCRLTFDINLELHQRIKTESLFNFKTEICIPLSNQGFSPELDIKIEISLQPDFLPTLKEHTSNLDHTFLKLNKEQPDHPLFVTENWLLISAIQQQESTQVGYRTLWNYLNPVTLVQTAASGSNDPISKALANFFQDWTQNNLSAVTEKASTEVVEGINNVFKGFADFNLDELKKLVKDIEQQFTNNWQPFSINKTIVQQIIDFFTQDDWNFTKLQGDSVLQLAFQGENGTWNCYAKVREEQKQFIFYSLCPITAPKDKRQAVAEFLSRANFGMMIGNFEFDFNDGEIRYKTCIDVTGDRLSFALIQNLVYTNVNIMDKYLPGIIAVINSNISPESAINQVEQSLETSQFLEENEQVSDVVSVDEQEQLAFKSSSQTEVKPQEILLNRKPHILAILTPEEIAQFHQALQVMPHYQRKQAEAIIEKVKKGIIIRLGGSGEIIFTQAYNLFSQVKIEIKNLKLIQRYAGIAERINLLLPNLNSENEEYKQLLLQGVNPMEELSDIFWNSDYRLRGLPTDKLEGRKEVELLVEIEEFRSKLAGLERIINQ